MAKQLVDISPVDGKEDTPERLDDNNTEMLIQQGSTAKFGRVSRFGNHYMYTAIRVSVMKVCV